MGSRRRSGVTRQEFRSGEFETLNRIPAQRDITDTEQACIEITRHGRRAFVLMSAEQHDWVRAAGRRAYRTTNATTVVINSVRLAEMDANHAAPDELLNETRRRASIQHREQQDGVRRAFRRSNAMKYMPRSFQP